MIPKSVLERLAGDPNLSDSTRRALRVTAERESHWRRLRDLHRLSTEARRQLATSPSILVFDCQGTESLPGIPINLPSSSPDSTIRRAFSQTDSLVAFYKG